MSHLDKFILEKGSQVKICGVPFIVESDTVLLGNKNNLCFCYKSLGVPPVLREAQDETSDTIKPFSSIS